MRSVLCKGTLLLVVVDKTVLIEACKEHGCFCINVDAHITDKNHSCLLLVQFVLG